LLGERLEMGGRVGRYMDLYIPIGCFLSIIIKSRYS